VGAIGGVARFLAGEGRSGSSPCSASAAEELTLAGGRTEAAVTKGWWRLGFAGPAQAPLCRVRSWSSVMPHLGVRLVFSSLRTCEKVRSVSRKQVSVNPMRWRVGRRARLSVPPMGAWPGQRAVVVAVGAHVGVLEKCGCGSTTSA
jgi:hypothetical protein